MPFLGEADDGEWGSVNLQPNIPSSWKHDEFSPQKATYHLHHFQFSFDLFRIFIPCRGEWRERKWPMSPLSFYSLDLLSSTLCFCFFIWIYSPFTWGLRMLMQLWNVKLSHKALWPHPTFWLLLLPPCGRGSAPFGGFLPWALSLSPVIPTILHWKLLHMTWLLESKVTSMLLFDNQFSLGGFNGFGK